jgi:autotransporter-associated beta strand protein
MTGYSRITFQQPVQLADISVTNTTYAYYVIRDGNKYSGGPFKAGDYFYATITGRDVSGNVTASIVYTLADYRNGNTFIAADWNTLDLSGLGQVKSLDISLTTTVFYQNSPGTPGYLAIDNLQIAGNPWGASWSDAQNTLWNVAANWGGTLPAPGESLLFDVPAGGISHNNRTDNPLVGAITFGSSAGVFTLEGQVARWQYDMTNLSENTQTVDMPLELTNAHQTIFTPLGDIVVSQPIGENSGSFGFVKTGSKTLFLSASNTYTGPTSIQEGSLCLLDGGDLATESVVTVAAGATLEVLGGDSVVGNINGAGTTIVYDGATLTAESIVQDTLVIGGTAYAAAAVPEPGTLLLLVLASAGLFVLTRKR